MKNLPEAFFFFFFCTNAQGTRHTRALSIIDSMDDISRAIKIRSWQKPFRYLKKKRTEDERENWEKERKIKESKKRIIKWKKKSLSNRDHAKDLIVLCKWCHAFCFLYNYRQVWEALINKVIFFILGALIHLNVTDG